MSAYTEMIRALKEFTSAKEALDRAEKEWDDMRYVLFPQLNEHFIPFIVPISSDVVGDSVRDFYRAWKQYENLGRTLFLTHVGEIPFQELYDWNGELLYKESHD